MKEETCYTFFFFLLIILFLAGCGLFTYFGIEMGFWNLFRFFCIIMLACLFTSAILFFLIHVMCGFISLSNKN